MNSVLFKEFEGCSNEQLVSLAQSGNKKAENELIVRSLPTVMFISGKYFSFDNSVGDEDFFQEALIGVVSAVYGFDESRGTAFLTYASRCVQNRLNRFLSEINEKQVRTVGLNENESLSDGFTQAEFEKVEADVSEMPGRMKGVLSDLEWNVWQLYYKGFRINEISSMLGITEKSCRNALTRAKKKLRELFDK